jgi:hypothetical protein
VTAAVPPLGLLIYQYAPGHRPTAPDWLQIALYAWPLVTILMRLDPDFTTKVNLFKEFRGGSDQGGGGSTPRA